MSDLAGQDYNPDDEREVVLDDDAVVIADDAVVIADEEPQEQD